KRENWKLIRQSGNPVLSSIISFRNRLEKYLDKLVPDQEENGYLKAIVLGDVSELSPYLLASYSGTGTMHVLSVSGLHVGILFIALTWLLFFLRLFKGGKVIFLFIALGFLWGYALLAGFSPPVARSAWMFSIMVIGTHFRRPGSIYNAICASAIIILL